MKLAVPYTELFRTREKEFLELVDTIELKNPISDLGLLAGKSLSLHLSEGVIQNCFWNRLREENNTRRRRPGWSLEVSTSPRGWSTGKRILSYCPA